MINFIKEEKKELVFHNIKNSYWNYFSLKINAQQNSFLYSSDLNFFQEFKKILEKEDSYYGFILEGNKPYNYEKNSCFSNFLTKEIFEKNRNKLVIDVLLEHWKINLMPIKTNTTRKYILFSITKNANLFLTNLELEINFLLENQNENFNFFASIKKIKDEYKVLNQNFHNLYANTEIKTEKQGFANDLLNLNSSYLSFENDSKNSEFDASFATYIIKNDIKNIINQHNFLLSSTNDDPYKIKIFIIGYSCFLKLIKETNNFRWLSSQQIYETYYRFEVWLSRLLEQKNLENKASVENYFNKTFADNFWIFWRQNREQKILENRNRKAQKHFKIKKINDFRKENPYYQNLKLNNKIIVRANILWQQEIIKIERKQAKKNFKNSYLGKKLWLISIENRIKKLQEKISKSDSENYFYFLKDIINDLKTFFGFYSPKKIDLFHKKNQFLIFCFKNGIDFDFLYQNYGDLDDQNLFFLETKKLEMGNYNRILFNESSFFLENNYRQKMIQHCFNTAKNSVQLFIYSQRTIKPIRDFSIIFIENGTLVEYISEIDLPLTPKTAYAKYFYQNNVFDRSNLYLLETHLYRQLESNVYIKNQNGISNNFESFINNWNPLKNSEFKLDFRIKKEWMLNDILVVDLK